MSYQSITEEEIKTGEPVAHNTQDKIRAGLQDHEGRIQALETGTSTEFPPLIWNIIGKYSSLSGKVDLGRQAFNYNVRIQGCFLVTTIAGSSGSSEIDIEWKRGTDPWKSIFNTRPSVPASAGNDAASTNAVLNPENIDVQAGDIIRLNLTAVQTGVPQGLLIRLDWERTE